MEIALERLNAKIEAYETKIIPVERELRKALNS